MVEFQRKDFYSYEDFLEIMRLLRAPGGCPWDREQTHSSIRRNFLEETYEVLDAIDHDDASGMCEELGDVLMQVAFHAQIEAERGNFTMDDVVDGVTKKLVYRHPHVFGSASAETAEEVLSNWDALKRAEKGIESDTDALRAVARTLPALWRAEKVLKKAAKAAGDKNMELVAVKELLGLTGYIRGGCSPVGMKKHYPTFIDETCTLWDEIAVSAGARGHQMIVPPQPLADLVGAELTDIIV